MKKSFCLLFALSIFLFGCKTGINPPEEIPEKALGSISGRVIYDNIEDSSGITVVIDRTDGLRSLKVLNEEGLKDSRTARSIVSYGFTTKDGSYKFENLEDGTYTIYAKSDSSLEEAVTTNVVVSGGGAITAEDLKLTPVGSIRGKITLDDSESNNAGFIVSIAGTSYLATTGSSGEFIISGIPAGIDYEIIIMYGTYTYFWKKGVEVKGFETESVGSINFEKSEIISVPEKGDKGDKGDTGKEGTSIVWLGTYASADEIKDPKALNAFFNTTDGCSYIYDGEKWTLLTTKGDKGETGTSTNGNDGMSIKWLGSFASTEEIENPEKLNAFFNTTDGCSYIYDGTKWSLLAAKGDKGENGTSTNGNDGTSIKWLGSFDSEEKIESPEKLNAFFNTTDGCSYIYDGEKWTLLAKGNAENKDEHVHTYSDEWSRNDDFHWHAATCEHTDQINGFGIHFYTFNKVLKPAECLVSGLEEYVCVCGETEKRTIPPTGHSYSDEWSYDENQHWHGTVCGHSEKKDLLMHEFATEVIQEATESENAIGRRWCTVCNYEFPVELPGTMTHEHHYNENFVCDCGKLKEFSVQEFLAEIGTSVKIITADPTKPGITKSDDSKTVNVYGVKISGEFSKESHFPSTLTNADLCGLDTSNVTDMSWMFYNCYDLEELNVDNFDTSNVTDMRGMFSCCIRLWGALDLSNFDTSNVTDMSYMFESCMGIGIIYLSNFDTSNVSNMEGMFCGCRGFYFYEHDLSNFNTSNVTNMCWMFAGCSNLEILDLSNFDTTKADCYGMFDNCKPSGYVDMIHIKYSSKGAKMRNEYTSTLINWELVE
ncbi:MAG: BspA family leucine-rich repeat surface protein [Treponema sp.]|nr:BspA family leucine-rich repeat surface protein [Treponema sp.]